MRTTANAACFHKPLLGGEGGGKLHSPVSPNQEEIVTCRGMIIQFRFARCNECRRRTRLRKRIRVLLPTQTP